MGVPATTLVINLVEVPAGDLASVDRVKVLDSLRKDLVRFGFSAVIGNLEVAYKISRNAWCVHVHLLVMGEATAAIERLANCMRSRGIPRAVDPQSLHDPLDQIPYLFKFVTYYRWGRRRKLPLPRPPLAELVGWWRPAKFTDHLFLLGFQRRGSIVAGSGFRSLLNRRAKARR